MREFFEEPTGGRSVINGIFTMEIKNEEGETDGVILSNIFAIKKTSCEKSRINWPKNHLFLVG